MAGSVNSAEDAVDETFSDTCIKVRDIYIFEEKIGTSFVPRTELIKGLEHHATRSQPCSVSKGVTFVRLTPPAGDREAIAQTRLFHCVLNRSTAEKSESLVRFLRARRILVSDGVRGELLLGGVAILEYDK